MYLRRASCEYKVETSSGEAPMQEREEEDDANAEKSVVPLEGAKTSLAKAVRMQRQQQQQQQQQREEPSCSPRSSSERMLLI